VFEVSICRGAAGRELRSWSAPMSYRKPRGSFNHGDAKRLRVGHRSRSGRVETRHDGSHGGDAPVLLVVATRIDRRLTERQP
jgi:hypothetical protein